MRGSSTWSGEILGGLVSRRERKDLAKDSSVAMVTAVDEGGVALHCGRQELGA